MGRVMADTGTVHSWDDARGFGFIAPDRGGDRVFVHHKAVVMEGRRTLEPGQRVEYDAESTPKGPRASSVLPCDLAGA